MGADRRRQEHTAFDLAEAEADRGRRLGSRAEPDEDFAFQADRNTHESPKPLRIHWEPSGRGCEVREAFG